MAGGGSRWSIAICCGPSPLALAVDGRADNPVLTAACVGDVQASFVADPFMHWDGSGWSMFFEVLDRARGRGCIGLATSPDALRWRYERVVLAEPFHLSYPFVFDHGGERFMVPETFEAAQVRLYRAARFPYEWTLDTVLLDRTVAVDASLLFHEGRWWMFGCASPKRHDVLRLWSAAGLRGPWREHPASPIVSGNARIGRPAGRPVAHAGRLYRFAQDCSREYGSCVRALEITRLTAAEYEEREASAAPVLAGGAAAWNARRMHHLDAHAFGSGWIACVDGDAPEQR
jgi:hypothetical protein